MNSGPRRRYTFQLRRKIGAFAQQGVATDAVIRLPDELAAGDFRRQILGMGSLGYRSSGMEGQREKEQKRKYRSSIKDIARHGLGEGRTHLLISRLKKLTLAPLTGHAL